MQRYAYQPSNKEPQSVWTLAGADLRNASGERIDLRQARRVRFSDIAASGAQRAVCLELIGPWGARRLAARHVPGAADAATHAALLLAVLNVLNEVSPAMPITTGMSRLARGITGGIGATFLLLGAGLIAGGAVGALDLTRENVVVSGAYMLGGAFVLFSFPPWPKTPTLVPQALMERIEQDDARETSVAAKPR